jgi:hypothetical protein
MDVAAKEELIRTLKDRFARHPGRHAGIAWDEVLARLQANPAKLQSLHEMERTGGQPDVVGRDADSGQILFVDCAPESPAERRSLCYDRPALDARKANKPAGNALEMAASMGIEVLTPAQYQALQELGAFDQKTSSWVVTPDDIRSLGGALFGDRRFGKVFIYHNGAESYYAARGFRGRLAV